MANIKKATKWLMDGNRVRRASWPSGDFVVRCEPCPSQMAYCIWRGIPNTPVVQAWDARLDSLIASDWELLPEQHEEVKNS